MSPGKFLHLYESKFELKSDEFYFFKYFIKIAYTQPLKY